MERDLAILADVLRDAPGARLHLTHLSTAGALDAVRRAKAAGLPVTCDVTPHHLALHRRVDRRRASMGLGGRRRGWDRSRPVGRRGARRSAVCLVAPRESAAQDAGGRGGLPRRARRRDGRCGRDRSRPAYARRQGGRVRLCVERDQRDRDRPRRPARRRRRRPPDAARRDRGADHRSGRLLAGWSAGIATEIRACAHPKGFVEGSPADLVVFDRADRWVVTPATLASKGTNTPLLGRELSGRVLVTVAAGRLAYEDRGEV